MRLIGDKHDLLGRMHLGQNNLGLLQLVAFSFCEFDLYGVFIWMFKELAIIEGSTEVLEEPFPKEYPGVSNKVIEVLQSGQEVEITGSQTGKDFKAYKMHLSDGRSGYIIAGVDLK